MVRLKVYIIDVKIFYLLGFNSTMVRLKVFPAGTVPCRNKFQFHNGSIKRCALSACSVFNVYCFNSTMVRLKAINAYLVNHRVPRFQFHNGSIKRPPSFEQSQVKPLFQFHNGSIKRRCSDRQCQQTSKFQFHNGSIKRQGGFANRITYYLFQFHNGSIKSIPRSDEAYQDRSFNSTMVRLKGTGSVTSAGVQCSFNSTMVRLKAAADLKEGKAVSVSIPQWFD